MKYKIKQAWKSIKIYTSLPSYLGIRNNINPFNNSMYMFCYIYEN